MELLCVFYRVIFFQTGSANSTYYVPLLPHASKPDPLFFYKTHNKLPITNLESSGKFEAEHEYIVVDILDMDLQNTPDILLVKELNRFCHLAEECDLCKTDLEVLCKSYFFNEILEKMEDHELPVIINFNDATSTWNNGYGGFYTKEDYGRCIYESGYNYLPEEVPTALMEYIDWEKHWTEANCNGWREVLLDENAYLVHS